MQAHIDNNVLISTYWNVNEDAGEQAEESGKF